ncbi:prolyl endopeptidase [Xylaria sp. FL1777]|nr:prolyl endopeptidase [Xylaria sp. FL1777]
MSNNGSDNPLFAARAHLRVARPTDSIPALIPFYVDGLGFEVKFTFGGHEGFDGILLGSSSSEYHLEFTSNVDHDAGRAPTQDNLLVFYIPNEKLYSDAVARMKSKGFEPVKSFNPYWDRCGTTFEDPDGYRVVLANMESPV